jgi:hypothetical protein
MDKPRGKTLPEFRILSTTAILGYGFPESSFRNGLRRKPHLIAADAGSTDPGPYYLGVGKSFTSRAGVKRDLRYMITEGVRRKIPVVVGSAGGSGARPHTEWCLEILREIAREEKLHFRLGVVYADFKKEAVLGAMRRGRVSPLAFVPDLTREAVLETEYIVGQMGIEPIIRLLKKKCDVVLAGRCYDPAVFAALPIMRGYDPGLALHLGKILECAAIAATPGSGSDCALGTLRQDSFILEALSPARRFTPESTAAHTLYEKTDPYHLPGPGGEIDLTGCSFTDIGGGRVEVRGSRFVPTEKYFIKLEGARPTGYRAITIAGVRDPIMIAGIDAILKSVEGQVRAMLKKEGNRGRVFFHVYGKDGVMGELEPHRDAPAHELGILIEALGRTPEEAEALLSVTRSTLLHYGYPGRISTAGNLAFPFSPSDITMGRMYEFSLYHLMELDDPDGFPSKVHVF